MNEATDRVPWRGWEAIVIWLLSLVSAAVLVVPVLFASDCDPSLRPEACDAVTVFAVLIQQTLLFGGVLLWVRLRYRAGPQAVGLRGWSRGNLAIGLGTAVAGVFLTTLLATAAVEVGERIVDDTIEQPQQIPLSGEPSVLVLGLLGFGVVVLTPLAEETLFRGFFYPALRRRFRPASAALISGAVFGLAHGHPLLIVPIFVLGVLLALVAERRRSIVPTVVAHALFNLFGYVAGYVL